ncbi:hypothetical protein [Sutcliffiella cohnii]|uniref:hypothetical protein n=1 Tax=Sutcliffiella cohnii TaxID=33932 RepID=UPI002E1E3C66|nr:hypothetical protein [Sutcliffiella cohnii]
MFKNRFLEASQYSGHHGWFNPEILQIYISGTGNSLNELNEYQAQVLNHELLHYLHFTSTTLGINFFKTNIRELSLVSEWKAAGITYERINQIYNEVLNCNRQKSFLLVPSYYYVEGPLFNSFLDANDWGVGTSCGTFFDAKGDISDNNFIMNRFTTGDPRDDDRLIARISMGTRYLFEHVIKFIDIFIDAERDGLEQAYSDHYDNSYIGQLLPYSALALLCANRGVLHINAFILSAIISHISLMVPLDWNERTNTLKEFTETRIRELFGRPDYSFSKAHPSVVVFALLEKATELGSREVDFYGMLHRNDNFGELNQFISRLCGSLDLSVNDLFSFYRDELNSFRSIEVDPRLDSLKHKLVEEFTSNLHIKQENFGKYIVEPHRTSYTPFIQGDRMVSPGNLLTYEEKE